jgi:hypothetical protein
MAWNPAEPPPSERPKIPAIEGRTRRTRADSQGERYGPVVIERRVKDDGRALVLYAACKRESK